MIQNFASVIAQKEVGMSWVSRFLGRHPDTLKTYWSTGINSNRHKADSWIRYKLYFDLLKNKMAQYEIAAENCYNMDEEGFMSRLR
jgi:hypothetical protein